MNHGFTLVELLVAVVASSVISIGALGVYSGYYRYAKAEVMRKEINL